MTVNKNKCKELKSEKWKVANKNVNRDCSTLKYWWKCDWEPQSRKRNLHRQLPRHNRYFTAIQVLGYVVG